MPRTARRVLTVSISVVGGFCLVYGAVATVVPLQVASFVLFSALTVLTLVWQRQDEVGQAEARQADQ